MTVQAPEFSLEQIKESIAFLLEDRVPYEFRTTVVRELHQKQDFEQMARWIQGAKQYYLQGFEDSGDLIRPGFHAYDKGIMEQALAIVRRYVPEAQLRGIDS